MDLMKDFCTILALMPIEMTAAPTRTPMKALACRRNSSSVSARDGQGTAQFPASRAHSVVSLSSKAYTRGEGHKKECDMASGSKRKDANAEADANAEGNRHKHKSNDL